MVMKSIFRYELYRCFLERTCFKSTVIFIDESNSVMPLLEYMEKEKEQERVEGEKEKSQYIIIDNEAECPIRYHQLGLSHEPNEKELNNLIFLCKLAKLADAVSQPFDNMNEALALIELRMKETEIETKAYMKRLYESRSE